MPKHNPQVYLDDTQEAIEKKALKEFKNRLFEKIGVNIASLRLFGSKARGDYYKESDIDILIVLKRATKKDKKLVLTMTVEMLLEYGINISPHIYSLKEFDYFNKVPSPFMQILQRESVTL